MWGRGVGEARRREAWCIGKAWEANAWKGEVCGLGCER